MNLNEIAEVAWRQLQPSSGYPTTVSLAEFQSSARAEYAYQTLLMVWQEKRNEGYYEVPGYLLKQVNKDVVNNQIDISDLDYFKSLPNEVWLQNIGGIGCDCRYVKSTINHTVLLCDDDSMDDEVKTYYIIGNTINFPDGTHKKTLPIIYADKGSDVALEVEVDDAIAAIIRSRLVEIYGGKVGANDQTNNNNKND